MDAKLEINLDPLNNSKPGSSGKTTTHPKEGESSLGYQAPYSVLKESKMSTNKKNTSTHK